MTEQEWLQATDPKLMLLFLRGRVSDRKLRLFAVACCRRIWGLLDGESREKVELAERFADGLAAKEEMPTPWPLSSLREDPSLPEDWGQLRAISWSRDAAKMAAALATDRMGLTHTPAWRAAYYAAGAVAWKIVGAARNATLAASWALAWNQTEADEYEEQVMLLRDILGNPFRPESLRTSWLTPDVITLAGHIYQDRAYRHLPELADALEEAGCDNADILSHCRSGGEHVRGCFVLDLLLGKS